MGSVEDVGAPGGQKAVDHFKMKGNVIGMKVLEELVAEGEVSAAFGQFEMISVVNNELEVCGEDLTRRTLIGDINAIHSLAPTCRRTAEAAITGSELDQNGFRPRIGKVGVEEAKLRFEVAARGFDRFATSEAGVIGDTVEQLGIKGLEELGALFSGRGSHPGGEFALDVVVMPEAFRGAFKGGGHG